MGKKFDFERFKNRAREIFGDKYEYLGYDYIDGKLKVKIYCGEKDKFGFTHGVFWKSPEKHLCLKQGCPSCSGKKPKMTNEDVIKRSKVVHTSVFDNLSYEKLSFKNYNTKVIVTCHTKDKNGIEHGDFEISPGHLLNGEGCPKCRYLKSSTSARKDGEEVIQQLKEIHPEYDYSESLSSYINTSHRIPVICHKKDKNGIEHGVFMMHPTNATNPYLYSGCPKCGRERTINAKIKCAEEFLTECSVVHNGFYDYSQAEYTSSQDYIYPICPIHGKFRQKASNHKMGQGCPLCFKEKSKVEREVIEYIKSIVPFENVIENDRTTLGGKEIDVFLPDKNIGFEVDGLIWHSDKFEPNNKNMLEKMELGLKKGVKIYNILEDEWNNKQEIVKSRIQNIFGMSKNRIYARKCVIGIVPSKEYEKFLNENHLQGNAVAKIRLGLYHDGELVSVMSFGKKRINVGSRHKDGEYELIRCCNKLGTVTTGGASKLLNHFVKEYKPKRIISYCDRRWSFGGLYEQLGFKLYNVSKPSYFYIKNKKRYNRFMFRKNILVEKYGCPTDKTEKEWCKENGYHRLYDCGSLCYELTFQNKTKNAK